ncbi:hypothetical protein CEUSTIGMA_g1549.t1 [Chlamydomonas eustigma]|uniref:Sfi1 spindle body domain-containing protein n=1 Tax=Chlamydomonas eustigma TaxID=1157962 RepID=A0A250WU59_9CHLO|nr:hypothetical protein CEUSTIGMA_g1549.t1 [Chlamydomonas eustigma]|eukprot:GAX74100.1 hypothetical protein CEUSTIGMA_g1549.t1 [Chlamydomonas eustigma]
MLQQFNGTSISGNQKHFLDIAVSGDQVSREQRADENRKQTVFQGFAPSSNNAAQSLRTVTTKTIIQSGFRKLQPNRAVLTTREIICPESTLQNGSRNTGLSSKGPNSGDTQGNVNISQSAQFNSTKSLLSVENQLNKKQTNLNASKLSHMHAAMSAPQMERDVEEERTRARRQHRKRVAQIVVDHWKWFARERLGVVRAARHHQRQQALSAFLALRQQVLLAAIAWKRALVFDCRRMFLMLSRCLQGWHVAALRESWLKRCQAMIVKGGALRCKRAIIKAWREQCVAGAVKRKKKVKSWYFYSYITLSRAMKEWQIAAAAQVLDAALKERALRFLRRKCLSSSLRVWQHGVRYHQDKAQKMSIAAGHVQRVRRQQVFSGWRECMHLIHTSRRAACLVLVTLAAHISRAQVESYFVTLKSYMLYRQHWRTLQLAGSAHMCRWRLRSCFSFWRWYSARVQFLRQCAVVMCSVGRRWRLMIYFQGWGELTAQAIALRSLEARELVLQRACLRIWKRYCMHLFMKAELFSEGCRRVHSVQLRHCLTAWKCVCERQQAKLAVLDLVFSWRRQRGLSLALTGWHSVVNIRLAAVHRGEIALQHCCGSLMKKALRAWVNFLNWRRLKAYSSAWHQGVIQTSILMAWRHHALYQQKRRLQKEGAHQHRRLSVLSKGMVGLKLAVQVRDAKLQLHQQMEAHRHSHLLACCLRHWAGEILAQAEEMHVSRTKAACMWKLRLLRVAMVAWHFRAAAWALRRELRHAAVRFDERHCLGRTLHQWHIFARAKTASRRAKEERLEDLRARLGSLKRFRVFAAWAQVNNAAVLKAIKMSQAACLRHRHLLQYGLLAWQSWLSRRQVKHILAIRGARHFHYRCLRCVLVIWRDRVRAWQCKRDAASKADIHYMSRKLYLGISALRWYRGYRKSKAADLLAAREMYVRRLQREGAAQWLAVGMWKKRLRLQSVAEKKAIVLAAENALVEPYARHWRRVTLQRQRLKLDGGRQQSSLSVMLSSNHQDVHGSRVKTEVYRPLSRAHGSRQDAVQDAAKVAHMSHHETFHVTSSGNLQFTASGKSDSSSWKNEACISTVKQLPAQHSPLPLHALSQIRGSGVHLPNNVERLFGEVTPISLLSARPLFQPAVYRTSSQTTTPASSSMHSPAGVTAAASSKMVTLVNNAAQALATNKNNVSEVPQSFRQRSRPAPRCPDFLRQ